MEKSEIKGFIAKRCAKELKNGDVVNLGIGLPTLIPNYLPKDVELIIHAELGIVSAGKSPKEGDDNYDPYHVVDAGGSPSSVAFGGGFIDSASNFGLIRGGHVDACFLGALEVDAEGNLANWIIPGKKMPGMGGAMDLCVGARKCIVCMEHTAKGNPKIFEKCRLPLTGFPLRQQDHHRDVCAGSHRERPGHDRDQPRVHRRASEGCHRCPHHCRREPEVHDRLIDRIPANRGAAGRQPLLPLISDLSKKPFLTS